MRRALLGLLGLMLVIWGTPEIAQAHPHPEGHEYHYYETTRQLPIRLTSHDGTWRAGDVELFKIVSQECAVEVGTEFRYQSPNYAPQLAECVRGKMHLEHKPWLSVTPLP